VFLFLYAEKVQDCNIREEGRSIANSVASMIMMVFWIFLLENFRDVLLYNMPR